MQLQVTRWLVKMAEKALLQVKTLWSDEDLLTFISQGYNHNEFSDIMGHPSVGPEQVYYLLICLTTSQKIQSILVKTGWNL